MSERKAPFADAAGAAAHRCCDAPGCAQPGIYRAPRGRDQLGRYYWFCLEHVRAYNKSWNYCAGMSTVDIESEIRQDTVWRRPTWPLGGGRSRSWRGLDSDTVADPFGFGEDIRNARRANGHRAPESTEFRAYLAMDLAPPVTLTQVKARYKELVKELHPDLNGGDKSAEERLKTINQAYATLKRLLTA